MSELRFAFDLYPRDDPLGGARILRFSDLEEAEWNAEANGTGSGVIILPGDSTDADSIDPRGLQYIRVVEIDPDDPDGATLSGFAERVVHGFFLDTGSFDALTEQNTKKLTFGGAGTLSYWARAVMAPHTYIHAVFTGQDPFDRTWRLDQQSTFYANGNYTGAMLWRVLYELSHFRSGATYTHKHADGIIYNDAHDDDRTESAVPDAVIDFTAFLDSNGNAWTEKVGEFRVGVLDNGLSVIRLLMELGAYVEMDPHTFETRAYQASSHRRDRTGGAWGSSVIRFQSPTDGTLDTGNILSDAKRALTAHIQRSTMWAGGGDDTYAKATGTFDIPWEGGLNSDANDLDALEVQADRQITARFDAGDTLRVRSVPIDDPTGGFYRPLHSTGVLLDDLATVHNGSGQWDFDEQTFPVAGVGGKLREGGDWDTFFDLGASFRPMEGRQFQVAALSSHTHPLNLCEPGLSSPATFVSATVGTPDVILTVGSLTDGALVIAVGLLTATWLPTSVTWTVGASVETATLVDSSASLALYVLLNPQVGSGTVVATGNTAAVWIVENAQSITSYAFASGTGSSTAVSVAAAAGELVLDAFNVFDADFLNDFSGPAATPGGGQTQDWSSYAQLATPGYVDVLFGGSHGDASPTWTLEASHPWDAFVVVVNGSVLVEGDGAPEDTVLQGQETHGTATRATRCDHKHAHGLLSDDELDYHEWPATGAPTDATYLVTTAHADLSAEIVVGATPGGELGGTWASPTVDATHSGSTHAATQAAAEATAAGALSTHAGAADPHSGYQKESEKGAASGYASLDGSTKVPIAQVPTGSTSTTVPLGDHTHASGGGELLMQDGVSSPPVPLENEAGTDWLYAG